MIRLLHRSPLHCHYVLDDSLFHLHVSFDLFKTERELFDRLVLPLVLHKHKSACWIKLLQIGSVVHTPEPTPYYAYTLHAH